MNSKPSYKDIKSFRELTPELEDISKIAIEGIVLGTGDIEHYDFFKVVKCKNCKYEEQLENEGNFRDFKIPNKCPDCNGQFKIIQETKGRIRKFTLQEVDVQSNPLILVCFAFGEDTLLIEPGKRIAVGGILRSIKKRDSDLTYHRVFDIEKIKVVSDKLIMPTELEIKFYKKISHLDMINSFAPNIQNMRVYKEAIIISLISGVKSEDIRGDINLFLVGDPGTAKTQLLRFITKIMQKSDYASGKSTSAAGLLAGVDNLSDGTRIPRAGPVVLCSGGVVALDEMDKMNPLDRSALHEAMETQTFSLKKIGINITWPAQTTIVGAANPKGGNKWNPQLSIRENVRLPDSLLSRFGLIFLVRDIPDKDNDLTIARHILKARQHKIEPKLSTDDFTKYINYAKTIKPSLGDEAGSILIDWWSALRLESQPEESPMVDHRTLEDLNRMAEAYAKWRFVDVVETQDATNAIRLLKISLQTLGMNTPGERNKSIAEFMNKDDYLRFIFAEPITEDMAVSKMLRKFNYWKTPQQARNEINKLRVAGVVFEKEEGIYKWVNF